MAHIHATTTVNGAYRVGECFHSINALNESKDWLSKQIQQDIEANPDQTNDYLEAKNKVAKWGGNSSAVSGSVFVSIARNRNHFQYTLKNMHNGPCLWL